MLGVSEVRVRQLIDAGDLRARQVGGRWLIDVASVPSSRRRGRPMSSRMAWGLVESGDGRRAPWLSPQDVYRLKQYRNRLFHDTEPPLLLKSWLAVRADRHEMSCPETSGLRLDPRVVLSGISEPRSRMSAANQVELYVHTDDYDDLCADHLLVPATVPRANVVVHAAQVRPADPVPVLLLAADLADHDGPRELSRARELIAQAFA